MAWRIALIPATAAQRGLGLAISLGIHAKLSAQAPVRWRPEMPGTVLQSLRNH
jgi:hypothetical protein